MPAHKKEMLFAMKLQRAILALESAQRQYEHYYKLRRDAAGNFVKGKSFTSAFEKTAYSNLLRARTNVKKLEDDWNARYALWSEFELDFTNNEILIGELEIKSAEYEQKMADIRTKMAIATLNENIVLAADFGKICTAHDRTLRELSYAQGVRKKLANRRPQQVSSLPMIKANLAITDNKTIGEVFVFPNIKEVPDALKDLQTKALKNNSEFKWADGIRPAITQTAPNMVDGFLAELAKDTVSNSDNKPTRKFIIKPILKKEEK